MGTRANIYIKTKTEDICYTVDGTSALTQIKDKKYHDNYINENLPIYLL